MQIRGDEGVVVLDLGTIDDSDWTYVNGTLGTTEDAHSIRHYRAAASFRAAFGRQRRRRSD